MIGPLVAPPAYWLGVVGNAWISGARLEWFDAARNLAVIVAYGLPVTYAVTLVWGAPVLYGLRRLGWLHAATLIPAGALGGTIAARFIAMSQQGALFKVLMPLPAGAVLGALTAAACWWAGQGAAALRGDAHDRPDGPHPD
jgi:hypothetical protein